MYHIVLLDVIYYHCICITGLRLYICHVAKMFAD